MYIFDRVVGKVVPTGNGQASLRYEFDFYQGTEIKPFKEAKAVADPTFLTDRVAALEALYASGNAGTVEFTSDTSKVRGYQGGLLHLLFNKGKMYLVCPLRGADAPSSPLMLDIQAGRLNLDNEEERSDNWQDSLIRKGFEVGYFTDRERVVPHVGSLFGRALDRSLTATLHTSYATAVPDVTAPLVPSFVNFYFDRNTSLAYIRVHKQGSSIPEVLPAGWAALPYVSSVELFQHIALHVQGEVRFTDMNTDKGKPVHRDIYVIDCETGQTQVWKAGTLLRVDDITVLLEENKEKLEEFQRQGKLKDGAVLPVSPKLSAAIRQLPSVYQRSKESARVAGLQELLQY